VPSDNVTALRSKDRDNNRWYTYPPTGERFLSVTTIIGGTQNKPWMEKWVAKKTIQWVIEHQDLLAEMDPTEFFELAKNAAAEATKVKADAGTYTHDLIEALILSQADGPSSDIAIPPIPEHLAGKMMGDDEDDMTVEQFTEMCIDGFLNFVSDHTPEFLASEMAVFNPVLRVAGTLDFIARFEALKITGCIDVKTGKHLKDSKEQLPACRRMTTCQLPMGEMAPMPATDCGMVLHLRPEYPSGYRLMKIKPQDDIGGWNRFQRAARLMTEREQVKSSKPGDVIYPPLPDGSQPLPLIADLDEEGYGRVISPLVKAGIGRVDELAKYTADDCLAIKGIGPKSLPVIAQLLRDHGLRFAKTAPLDMEEAA
jgi:hypothetical protein